jgi:hypothetical protein
MARSFIIPSLVLLAIGACWPDADLQLEVSRSDSSLNLAVQVCRGDACNKPTTTFDPVTEDAVLEKRVSILVDNDVPSVVVQLDTGGAQDLCVDVTFGSTTLRRDVDLDAADPWACPSGTCETPYSCPRRQ